MSGPQDVFVQMHFAFQNVLISCDVRLIKLHKAMRCQSGWAKNHTSAGSLSEANVRLGPLHCTRDQLPLSSWSMFKLNDTVAALGTHRALGLVNGAQFSGRVPHL